jgi:hypothetical protein
MNKYFETYVFLFLVTIFLTAHYASTTGQLSNIDATHYIAIIISICSTISGITGSHSLNLMHRPASLGIIICGIMGMLGGFLVDGATGYVVALWSAALLMLYHLGTDNSLKGAFFGCIAAMLAGGLTGGFIGGAGFTHQTTLLWILLCLLAIGFEYLGVMTRIYLQKEKQ